jgi:hypothetical protein
MGIPTAGEDSLLLRYDLHDSICDLVFVLDIIA